MGKGAEWVDEGGLLASGSIGSSISDFVVDDSMMRTGLHRSWMKWLQVNQSWMDLWTRHCCRNRSKWICAVMTNPTLPPQVIVDLAATPSYEPCLFVGHNCVALVKGWEEKDLSL